MQTLHHVYYLYCIHMHHIIIYTVCGTNQCQHDHMMHCNLSHDDKMHGYIKYYNTLDDMMLGYVVHMMTLCMVMYHIRYKLWYDACLL